MNDDRRDEQSLPDSLDPRLTKPVRTRTRRTTTWVLAVRVLCGVLSVVLLGGAAYGTALLNRIQTSAGTLDSTDGEHNVDRVGNFDDENILVVGNDSRDGYSQEDLDKIGASDEGSMATDSIMLIHVPANGESASVVSFPRDSWVDIPGYGESKINSAFVSGYSSLPDGASEAERRAEGQKTLIATVSQLSGMKVDHYVEVSLLGFYDLTEALGGIEVNLCEPAYDPSQNSGADFPAGKQTLDGSQALSFVRQREGLNNGDLDRIKRQQFFVGAVLRKVLDQDLLDLANIGKLTDIIDALTGTINYSKGLDPLELADQMSAVATGDVTFQTVPVANQDAKIGEASVVLLEDQDSLDEFFENLSGGGTQQDDAPATETTEAPETLDPAEVSVEVYNGTTAAGAGQTAADALTEDGFTVTGVLPAATADWAESVVQYPPGMEAEAATVAAAVGGGTKTEESADIGSVMLIVGANYPGLSGGSAQPGSTESTSSQSDSSQSGSSQTTAPEGGGEEPSQQADDVMTADEGTCVY
ncbi:MAG: LCP family protein [Cumulibacter sp.]